MADNAPLTSDASRKAATDQVTYSGETADVQLVRLVGVTGAEGAKTVVDLPAGAEYTHDVALTPATTSGPALIGRASDAAVTAVAADDAVLLLATLLGKLVAQPYAVPALTWSYAAAAGGITDTTPVTVKAAGDAGIRNYVKSAQVINKDADTDTEVEIRDGTSGTVLHRMFAKAGGGGFIGVFEPPLRGSAATLVAVACVTTGASVLINLQGFTAGE